MPPKTFWMIVAGVILAAGITVWAATNSGAPLALLTLAALLAAGALRRATRHKGQHDDPPQG